MVYNSESSRSASAESINPPSINSECSPDSPTFKKMKTRKVKRPRFADFEKMEERQATGEFPFIVPKTDEEKDLLLLGTSGEAAQIDSFVGQHLEEFLRSQPSVSDRLPEKYLQARWYRSNCNNVTQMCTT